MNGNDSDLPRSSARRWLKRFEVDRAVFFALATRFWQMLASPVTALLIAARFTREVQGFYFTFWNLVGLQTFVELGFQQVIIHVASHEWSRLALDGQRSVHGDEQARRRLASLVRLVVRWYATAAFVFVPVVTLIGGYFFSRQPGAIPWLAPWVALVLLAGLSLGVSGFVALLEGCNQVATVQRYRLPQAISGHVVVWTLILSGAELWVTVAAAGVQLLWEIYLVAVAYREFWISLRGPGAGDDAVMSWRHDVWPLQWRIAVQSVLHFFAYQLFVPVMFHYHSPGLAGEAGMTWTILFAFQSISFAWVQSRTPQLGMLVARREFTELDRLFGRLTRVSLAVLVAGAVALCAGVAAVNYLPDRLSQRLATRILPPAPVLILSAGVVLLHVPRCLSVYLRAHKRDPLFPLIATANTIMGLVVFALGSRYGALAASIGFTVVAALIILPGSVVIWRRCRSEWHSPP